MIGRRRRRRRRLGSSSGCPCFICLSCKEVYAIISFYGKPFYGRYVAYVLPTQYSHFCAVIFDFSFSIFHKIDPAGVEYTNWVPMHS